MREALPLENQKRWNWNSEMEKASGSIGEHEGFSDSGDSRICACVTLSLEYT